MGDRTYVTLTILASQQDEAIKHFDGDADEAHTHGLFAHHTFYEVNYGNLQFLDELQAAGIAYDSQWEAGSEYGPGCDYCRFTADGDVVLKSISDSYQNPSLTKLMEKINNYEELRAFIIAHHEEVSVLSWDFQEEYGKLYRTKQLIAPNETLTS